MSPTLTRVRRTRPHRTARSAVIGRVAAVALALGSLAVAVPAAPAVAVTAPTCDGIASQSTVNSVTYADRLIRAWGAGNTRATACYANTTVRNALWSLSDTGGRSWQRTTVEGAAGTIYVGYTNLVTHARITIGVTNVGLRATGGWHAAYRVQMSGVTNSHASRSDALVRAWGTGDRVAASYFGTSDVVRTLFARRAVGGAHWYLVSIDGVAGGYDATYRDRATGLQVTLHVTDPLISGTWAHDVNQIRFGR